MTKPKKNVEILWISPEYTQQRCFDGIIIIYDFIFPDTKYYDNNAAATETEVTREKAARFFPDAIQNVFTAMRFVGENITALITWKEHLDRKQDNTQN